MMNFSDKDLEQIKKHGLTVNKVNKQLERFEKGFPRIDIVSQVSVGDGVFVADDMVYDYMANAYTDYARTHKIVKFVPASGAATRMFKDFYEFVDARLDGMNNIYTAERLDEIDHNVLSMFDVLSKSELALLDTHGKRPRQAPGFAGKIYRAGNFGNQIRKILELYGDYPKGLIPFHKYSDGIRTALEEHLVEGAQYAVCENQIVNMHFTVSPGHKRKFKKLLDKVVPLYEEKYKVSYNIELSVQKKSTDTIAVYTDNTPFRNSDGSLLFRPAGHGALINNLNNIDADLIFIKNIDNVTTDDFRADTIKYKKVLAGILISIQQNIFNLIRLIDSDKSNVELLTGILHDFVTTKLGIKLQNKLPLDEYRKILNRPLRVCGIVKNTGAPGGGPFWVRGKDGNISLQIVESNQIARTSKDIMNKSEYFNPVDIVCGTRDFQGNKFNLKKYIDKDTGFISEKTKDGKALLAMERPGLWNGAMAGWNTIFVPVPASTFTPVKVITDLLSPMHRTK